MRKSLTALAAVVVFTACDGNPFESDETDGGTATDPEPVTTEAIPDSLASNLKSITYDPVAKTLTVEIAGIDGSSAAATYARNAAAEAGLPAGVEAYSLQEDPLDRFFVALVKESADGTVRAGVVSDGGQFNRFFSGGYYERDGEFTPPTSTGAAGSGQVSYAGDYAGLDNWSGPVPPLPPGSDPSFQMQAPGRVTGRVFINANFDDMQINGSVFDRTAIDLPTTSPLYSLDTLILVPGSIAADGTFFGDSIELDVVDPQDIGDYGGIIGGLDGASLGGVLVITNFIDDALMINESETGFFVLTQCGMPGEDATLCASVAP